MQKCGIVSLRSGSGTRIKIQHFLEMLDPDPYILNTIRNPATEECTLSIFLQSHILVTRKPLLPSLSSTGKRDNFLPGEGGEGGGRGAYTYDRKKAWSSVNNSILSACNVANLRWLKVPPWALVLLLADRWGWYTGWKSRSAPEIPAQCHSQTVI